MQTGLTPLNFAVFCGNTEITLELVKAKADVNKNDSVCVRKIVVKPHTFDVFSVHRMYAQNGLTPLSFAVGRGHTEMVVAFIKAKADVNYVNNVRVR